MSAPRPYYEDEFVTLYHGDCREILPCLTGHFDLVVTDPPYGMKKADWDMDIVPVSSWLVPLRCPTAIFVGVRGIYDYPKPDWVMAWVRQGSTQRAGALRGFNNWEPIIVYHVASLANDVISLPNRHEAWDHPSVKPTELMSRLLRLMPEGTVLDPFCGTGTTLLAAKRLNRLSIGVERQESYCEIAAQRLSQNVLDFGGAA